MLEIHFCINTKEKLSSFRVPRGIVNNNCIVSIPVVWIRVEDPRVTAAPMAPGPLYSLCVKQRVWDWSSTP